VSNPPSRTEHYRLLANEHRRLASNDSSTENQDYHLLMAKNFITLAEVVGADDNSRPANND
jgi:ribosomal protein S4E